MARPVKKSQSPAFMFHDDIYDATPEPSLDLSPAGRVMLNNELSPSPATSISSDKENRSSQSQTVVDNGKGRANLLHPARLSTSLSGSDRSGKRRRTEDREAVRPYSRRRRTAEPEEEEEEDEEEEVEESDEAYDPEQNVEERRKLRRDLRNLHRGLNDNRAEYLKSDSTGLVDTLKQANQIFTSVKQTTDGTIDSRLLVTVGDLSYKKTVQLTLGDSVQGVDLDEFVTKCIAFMRGGDAPNPDDTPLAGTQRGRRRHQDLDSDGEAEDVGDENNWDHLGRNICLQYNSRPSVPGFLLGPLSLEKRARKATQRSQGLKINSLRQTQPEVISAAEIEKQENANLTVLCTRILGRLKKVTRDGMAAVEAEATDDMEKGDIQAIMDKHGMHETGGVDFFKFVVNPYSFGQTVENLFYVSFLIRDGKAGITINESGLPSIEITQPRSQGEAKRKGVAKHQAVFAINMAQWKDIIEVFKIKRPMIEHREEQVQEPPDAREWVV